MKKKKIITLFGVCLVLAVASYGASRFLRLFREQPVVQPPSELTTLQASPHVQQQTGAPERPLPPPPVGPTAKIQPEPTRTLVGATRDQLKQVEQYLPEGARVVTYPVSEIEERPAFASADLIGDGRNEIVVVYRAPGPPPDGGGQPLFLGVLRADGEHLTLSSSTGLYGGLIYIGLGDKHTVPFAIRDVTGDGRPEIIVTSGVGASLGGAIQLYSFNGSSLQQLAFANGHVLRLYDKEITAQSRYEDKPRVYRWNGQTFKQVDATARR